MIEQIIIIPICIIGAFYIMYKIGKHGEFERRSEYFKDQYKFGKDKTIKKYIGDKK